MVMSIVYPRLFGNEVRKKERKDITFYHFENITIKKTLAALFIYFDRRLHFILILEYKMLSIKSISYQSQVANEIDKIKCFQNMLIMIFPEITPITRRKTFTRNVTKFFKT